MIILDTNVLSEALKIRPDPTVARWISQVPQEETVTTVITIAELRFGVEQLEQGRRRAELHALVEQGVAEAFRGRILPFAIDETAHYASVVAVRRRAGRPIKVCDAMIAAIGRSHGAIVATRDFKDFEGTGVTLINPWET
ncbi:type II toxin-antitoxin system VapC family toxin [Glycomyces albus]